MAPMVQLRFLGVAAALVVLGLTADVSRAQTVAPLPTPPSNKIETELVELGPNGFYPPAIVRKNPGKYYLMIRVNLGEDAPALRLESEAGVTLKESATGSKSKRWGQLIDVSAGNYLIRAPGGKSTWVLRMTVPQGKSN